mgnify:CR=1 FL=1
MRRATYCDPVSGKSYRFLTTEMTLPPGLIAFIYKLRRARHRLDKQMAKAKASVKAFNSLVSDCLRVIKRSLQFLRWLSVWPAAEKLLERLYRNSQASYG